MIIDNDSGVARRALGLHAAAADAATPDVAVSSLSGVALVGQLGMVPTGLINHLCSMMEILLCCCCSRPCVVRSPIDLMVTCVLCAANLATAGPAVVLLTKVGSANCRQLVRISLSSSANMNMHMHNS